MEPDHTNGPSVPGDFPDDIKRTIMNMLLTDGFALTRISLSSKSWSSLINVESFWNTMWLSSGYELNDNTMSTKQKYALCARAAIRMSRNEGKIISLLHPKQAQLSSSLMLETYAQPGTSKYLTYAVKEFDSWGSGYYQTTRSIVGVDFSQTDALDHRVLALNNHIIQCGKNTFFATSGMIDMKQIFESTDGRSNVLEPIQCPAKPMTYGSTIHVYNQHAMYPCYLYYMPHGDRPDPYRVVVKHVSGEQFTFFLEEDWMPVSFSTVFVGPYILEKDSDMIQVLKVDFKQRTVSKVFFSYLHDLNEVLQVNGYKITLQTVSISRSGILGVWTRGQDDRSHVLTTWDVNENFHEEKYFDTLVRFQGSNGMDSLRMTPHLALLQSSADVAVIDYRKKKVVFALRLSQRVDLFVPVDSTRFILGSRSSCDLVDFASATSELFSCAWSQRAVLMEATDQEPARVAMVSMAQIYPVFVPWPSEANIRYFQQPNSPTRIFVVFRGKVLINQGVGMGKTAFLDLLRKCDATASKIEVRAFAPAASDAPAPPAPQKLKGHSRTGYHEPLDSPGVFVPPHTRQPVTGASWAATAFKMSASSKASNDLYCAYLTEQEAIDIFDRLGLLQGSKVQVNHSQ